MLVTDIKYLSFEDIGGTNRRVVLEGGFISSFLVSNQTWGAVGAPLTLSSVTNDQLTIEFDTSILGNVDVSLTTVNIEGQTSTSTLRITISTEVLLGDTVILYNVHSNLCQLGTIAYINASTDIILLEGPVSLVVGDKQYKINTVTQPIHVEKHTVESTTLLHTISPFANYNYTVDVSLDLEGIVYNENVLDDSTIYNTDCLICNFFDLLIERIQNRDFAIEDCNDKLELIKTYFRYTWLLKNACNLYDNLIKEINTFLRKECNRFKNKCKTC